MNCNHTIHKECHHFGWDNSIEPALSVSPGETVEVNTVDSSGGQLTSGSTVNFTGTVGIAVPDASYIRKIHASPLNVRGAPYGDLNVHQGFSYSVVEKGVTAGTHLYRFMLAHDGNSIWQGTKGAAGTRFDAKAVKR